MNREQIHDKHARNFTRMYRRGSAPIWDKLICGVCGKPHATLGAYGDKDVSDGWWLCLECFGMADELAALENRSPEHKDYRKLRALARKIAKESKSK